MRKPFLALLALLSLLSFAPSMAQVPPVAGPDSNPVTLPAPDAVAEFLATLSPAPTFMSGCTDNSQCPTGQICCYLCGYQPDPDMDTSSCRACVTPTKYGCPLVA
jgi:hypothetical protein